MSSKRLSAAVIASVLVLAAVSPAAAANVFDDLARLFGRPATPAVEHAPLEVTVRPRGKPVRKPEASLKPPTPALKLDPATGPYWYLADSTLRRGDIVVTLGGVMVYQGRNIDVLRRADFVPLSAGKNAKGWKHQLETAAAGGRSFFDPASAPPKPTPTVQAEAAPKR